MKERPTPISFLLGSSNYVNLLNLTFSTLLLTRSSSLTHPLSCRPLPFTSPKELLPSGIPLIFYKRRIIHILKEWKHPDVKSVGEPALCGACG